MVTHAKVSAKPDPADTSLIGATDWNAQHAGGSGAESPLVLTSTDPAEIPLTIESAVGQTAPLLNLKDENDLSAATVTVTDESVDVYIAPAGDTGAETEWWTYTDETGSQSYFTAVANSAFSSNLRLEAASGDRTATPAIFGGGLDASAVFALAGGASLQNGILLTHTTVGGLIRATAVAAQSGPVFEIRDASTAPVFSIGPTGVYRTAAHAAPADGDIAAGEMATWFDQTNGAAALKIKAKTADGTVVTATVPLT